MSPGNTWGAKLLQKKWNFEPPSSNKFFNNIKVICEDVGSIIVIIIIVIIIIIIVLLFPLYFSIFKKIFTILLVFIDLPHTRSYYCTGSNVVIKLIKFKF